MKGGKGEGAWTGEGGGGGRTGHVDEDRHAVFELRQRHRLLELGDGEVVHRARRGLHAACESACSQRVSPRVPAGASVEGAWRAEWASYRLKGART